MTTSDARKRNAANRAAENSDGQIHASWAVSASMTPKNADECPSCAKDTQRNAAIWQVGYETGQTDARWKTRTPNPYERNQK